MLKSSLLAAVVYAVSLPGLAAAPPDLASVGTFAIVSGTFSNVSAGSAITGDVCYTTGPAVTPAISGDIETPCAPQRGIDQSVALAHLNAQSCEPLGAAVTLNEISIDGGPPGEFPPGCYSSTGAMSITEGTTVTLSGNGVYIFRPDGAMDAAANASVVTADDACENDVFWTPSGATTLGASAVFVGTIFSGHADGLSITLGDSASLTGRALAYGSTVTADNTTISVPDCKAIPPVDPGISLTKTITDGDPYAAEGDTISYLLVAENTGEVTLSDVTISDPDVILSNCEPVQGSTLGPNDMMSCEGTYTVLQADVNAGSFTNIASVVGFNPDDEVVHATDSATASTTTTTTTAPLAVPVRSMWAIMLMAGLLALFGLAFFRK